MARMALGCAMLLLSAGVAQAAADCSIGVSGLSFGVIDTLGTTPPTTSADVSINCEDITSGATQITVCGNLGPGSMGESDGVRQMQSGAAMLGFVLSTAGSVPWGSTSNPELGNAAEIDIPVSGDTVSYTAHIHGTIPTGQSAAAVGDYSTSFSSTDAAFRYAEGGLDCGSTDGTEVQASFTATASVPANCLLQTADLDFGTTGLIGHNIDDKTTVGVTCTPGTAYTISIDGGGSHDPTHRQMRAGQETVNYGLYTDSGRNTIWGTGDGAGSTVSDTGDGAKHNSDVYGRIPPQPAAPGSYSDTVVVTIAY